MTNRLRRRPTSSRTRCRNRRPPGRFLSGAWHAEVCTRHFRGPVVFGVVEQRAHDGGARPGETPGKTLKPRSTIKSVRHMGCPSRHGRMQQQGDGERRVQAGIVASQHRDDDGDIDDIFHRHPAPEAARHLRDTHASREHWPQKKRATEGEARTLALQVIVGQRPRMMPEVEVTLRMGRHHQDGARACQHCVGGITREPERPVGRIMKEREGRKEQACGRAGADRERFATEKQGHRPDPAAQQVHRQMSIAAHVPRWRAADVWARQQLPRGDGRHRRGRIVPWQGAAGVRRSAAAAPRYGDVSCLASAGKSVKESSLDSSTPPSGARICRTTTSRCLGRMSRYWPRDPSA